jgi:hypothetical protein
MFMLEVTYTLLEYTGNYFVKIRFDKNSLPFFFLFHSD